MAKKHCNSNSIRKEIAIAGLRLAGKIIFKKRQEVQMAKPLTKSQIADQISKKTGVTKKIAGEMINHLAQLSYKEAKNSFTIPGIGKLVLVKRKARMGRNPQTGAAIKIPAKKVVKFRVAKACKDAVLS